MLGRYNRLALNGVLVSAGALAGRASFFFSDQALRAGSIACFLPHLLCGITAILLSRAGYVRESTLLCCSWTAGYILSTYENRLNKQRLQQP